MVWRDIHDSGACSIGGHHGGGLADTMEHGLHGTGVKHKGLKRKGLR